jgi:hypothetical protein
MKTLILLIGLLMMAPVNAEQDLFSVLVQDKSLVRYIRSEGDNVWIKLASAKLADEVTVRISNKDKKLYRTWFNGNVDLESKGFRGSNAWSDRVQTKANYIEYWLNGTLVLHLKRR